MATGLMGYRNTTPTGMEGVGGNAAKEAVVPPTMNNINGGVTSAGNEMTDSGQSAGTAITAFDNLSEESKASIISVASPDTVPALKEFLVAMGISQEDANALDSLPMEEKIHIPLKELINNPDSVMSQLEQISSQLSGQTENNQMNSGMMSEGNMTDTNRPPVV
jgi:hypothetical protein